MNISSLVYPALAGLLLGVIFASLSAVSVYFLSLLLLMAAFLAVFYFLREKVSMPARVFFVWTAVFFSFFALGSARFMQAEFLSRAPALSSALGRRESFEAVVSAEPSERGARARIVAEADILAGENIERRKILLWTDIYPKLSYGDRISFSGVLEEPEDFETEEGRMFGYGNYLSAEGVFYQISASSVKLISSGEGNFIKRALFSAKGAMLGKLKSVLPEPDSSLVSGLLLGVDESIGENRLLSFRKVGLIHIVVLSGYNLSIVSSVILRTMAVIPPIFGLSSAVLGIIAFAVMVGGSATVIRASIMAILAIFARLFGRKYDILRALLLAGGVMVFHNPYILFGSLSFQLSFMATLGIVVLAPKIEGFLDRHEVWGWLKEVISTTLSAQIFVLPLILWAFGSFSLLSLPANLLVLPVVPWAMFFGFLSIFLGFFGQFASFAPAVITHILTSYMFKISLFLADIPWFSFFLRPFSLWWLVGTYIAYGLFLWLWSINKKSHSTTQST